MIKIGKNIANLLMKTAIISSMAIPSIFSGCKKPDYTPEIKSIEQSVALRNDADNYIGIDYSSTLSNVSKAQLNVKREGVLISEEEISDASYKKTYEKAEKGKYEFILTSDNLKKDNNMEIPDSPSSIDAVNIDLNENSKKTVSLKTGDENYEDNPVSVVYAKSLDEKTETKLEATSDANVYNLDITASNQTGAYQLEIELKNAQGGLEKTVLNGNIAEDNRIDYTHRPNQKDLNWYGSGDVNNDNTINEQDLTRLNEIIAGTYSNPSDTRLMDRADVNGDGVVNNDDTQILENKLNGKIPYLSGDWDNLPTRAEKENWAKKMLAIDKTNTTAFPGGNCNQFADQTYIDFHGVDSIDIPKFQEVYNYDFTNNGRFNLPLEEVIMTIYSSGGDPDAHTMNALIFGYPSLSFGNICPIEPSTDQMNVPIIEDPLLSINTNLYTRGPPVIGVAEFPNGKKIVTMTKYVEYNIKDKIPTLTWVNPNLINQK
jgi:hypothetical protein